MTSQLVKFLGLSAALAMTAQPVHSNAFAEAVAAVRSGQSAMAVQRFRQLADAQNGAAQFNLAVLYARGTGVPQSDELALYWGWRARFSGVKQAKILTKYLTRGATPQLLDKVQRSLRDDLRNNINAGKSEDMLSLGRVYLELTQPSDPEAALVWFTIAAALEQPTARTWRDVVARQLDREQRLSAQEKAANLYQEWCNGHAGENPMVCSYGS